MVRQVYGLQVRMLASIADAHTEAVYTLASFTNGQDAWSDAATATVARGALAGLGGQDTCHRLLAQYVKPVCIDSRALGHKVTSEGRRDYYSNRRPNYHYQSGYNELDDATPLQKRPEISTVMSYCITTLQVGKTRARLTRNVGTAGGGVSAHCAIPVGTLGRFKL